MGAEQDGGLMSVLEAAEQKRCRRPLWQRKVVVLVLGVGVFAATELTNVADPKTAAATVTCAPQQVSATPNVALDNLFQTYGNSGTGTSWTGGDGTESVALPDGRELWIFEDTLLGKVRNGQRNRKAAPYIHNSFVIESNGTLTATLYTARPRSAYVNPVRKHTFTYGFFPGGSVVNGGSVQVLMAEVKFTRRVHQNFNFVVLRDYVGVFSLPNLTLVGVQPVPFSGIDWSAGVLSDSGYTYIYGGGSGNVYAARVPGTDLTQPWAYYGSGGWTANASGAVPIENKASEGSHLSVTRVAGTFGVAYALVTASSGNKITTAFGCSPIGPFGARQAIYTTPEPSKYPASDGVITYGAHAHPELSSSSNTLVISYDVDPIGPKGLAVRDASIYRPRFIDVTLH
jgi:hypothetical protein